MPLIKSKVRRKKIVERKAQEVAKQWASYSFFFHINVVIESGRFKVAALTNNSETAEDQNKTSDSLREIFDHFVESKVVGLR